MNVCVEKQKSINIYNIGFLVTSERNLSNAISETNSGEAGHLVTQLQKGL